MDDLEIPLVGGDVTTVVRVGDTVRRTAGWWTATIHALLDYLKEAGFEGAPRALGIDDEGREVLSYIEGEAALVPLAEWARSDEVIAEIGSFLRNYHDVVSSFVPPSDARWRYWEGAPRHGDVICHMDLFPPNVIFRQGEVVALIDWDFAAPGDRLFDIASAAKHWVPLMDDRRCAAEGLAHVDKGSRLRLLSDSYGLDRAQRGRLLDFVMLKQQLGYASHKAWGEAGEPGFERMWGEGSGELMTRDMEWLRRHRSDLQPFLA